MQAMFSPVSWRGRVKESECLGLGIPIYVLFAIFVANRPVRPVMPLIWGG